MRLEARIKEKDMIGMKDRGDVVDMGDKGAGDY